jgi:hypothetical protein
MAARRSPKEIFGRAIIAMGVTPNRSPELLTGCLPTQTAQPKRQASQT